MYAYTYTYMYTYIHMYTNASRWYVARVSKCDGVTHFMPISFTMNCWQYRRYWLFHYDEGCTFVGLLGSAQIHSRNPRIAVSPRPCKHCKIVKSSISMKQRNSDQYCLGLGASWHPKLGKFVGCLKKVGGDETNSLTFR